MSNSRRILKLVRWLMIIVCAGFFVQSIFSILALDKGLSDSRLRIVSANGAFGINELHSRNATPNPAWQTEFILLSRFRGNIATMFNWSGLGFHIINRSGTAYWVRGIIIPYWAVILLLLTPELGLIVRRVRQSVITHMPPMPTREDSSEIVRDLPCVHCGYNLRMQHGNARCPECGSAIVDTLTLSEELASSRPGWLRGLAIGSVLLILARVGLLVIYAALYNSERRLAGWYAIVAATCYLLGTYLITRREHPYLQAKDQRRAMAQRTLALAVLSCIAAGLLYRIYFPRAWPWSINLGFTVIGSTGYWSWPTVMFLVGGWLVYCISVVVEYRFLAGLAGRLLDKFMIEHCIIAGIGAGITSALMLFVTRDLFRSIFAMPVARTIFFLAICVFWLLFAIWTGFMNVYCAGRFIEQSWMASERWKLRKLEQAAV